MNLDPRFEEEFRSMTPADRAVIQQAGRLFAYKILAPVGMIKGDYLTPEEYLNLAAIHDQFGSNIPNVVLRGSTVYALAELISAGLADSSALSHIERFYDDLMKTEIIR